MGLSNGLVMDCLCKPPDLNLIENARSYMNRHLRAMERGSTSVVKLHDAIKRLWCLELDRQYFLDLCHSVLKYGKIAFFQSTIILGTKSECSNFFCANSTSALAVIELLLFRVCL